MSLRRLLEDTAIAIEQCIQELAENFERPYLNEQNGYPAFRHKSKHDLLASYLKGVRIVSNFNAALVLLRAGHVQEVYVLCRAIDEAAEDITFLATPLGENGASDDQKRFVNEFFQEEFSDPSNPVKSQQKRDRVSRKRIHAALSRLPVKESNPSRMQEIASTLHHTYSGFVHGAYGHIMELYGGNPGRFHTSGMNNTPRISECETQLVNYLYRALLALEVIALRSNRKDISQRLLEQAIKLAQKTGCVDNEEILALSRRINI